MEDTRSDRYRSSRDERREKDEDRSSRRSHRHHNHSHRSHRHRDDERRRSRSRDRHHHRHDRERRRRSSDRERRRSPERRRRSRDKYRERSRERTPKEEPVKTINPITVEIVDEDSEGEWYIEPEPEIGLPENVVEATVQQEDLPEATREEQKSLLESEEASRVSKLNKLTADLYKAQIKKDTQRITELQKEIEAIGKSETATVKIIDSRFQPLPTNKQATEEEKSLQDLLQEERNLSRGGKSLDTQLAARIATDGSYELDTDYQDDVAGKLAKTTQESEQAIRSRAIAKTRQLESVVENCWLCMENGDTAATSIVSIANRSYVCMAPEPVVVKGTLAIVPMDHCMNTLECDDDEWEEIRNYMKTITQMWHDQNKAVIFYETAVSRSMKKHACIMAVPLPFDLAESSPGFFSEAILNVSDEWGSHRKIIDTRATAKQMEERENGQGTGKYAFRASIAKEAPYFHVWVNLNGGIGHIVEEGADRWPRDENMFGRDVVGGMVQADPAMIRRKARWTNRASVEYDKMLELYNSYDWAKA
ncbi:hypothetical protein TRVA0_069S00606 [Trichomonascus vanleenenianus]|uniref:CWF19 family protein n=1 Tax=Trichomonascus vanleenenianus TaxID=2268995 RepID=UPI003EC99304